MPQARQRVWLRRFLLGALVVIGVYGLLTLVAGVLLEKQVHRAAEAMGAVVKGNDHSVSVGLLSMSGSIFGLVLERRPGPVVNHLVGRIDTVEVRGVSIWKWIQHRRLDLAEVTLRFTDLNIVLCDSSEGTVTSKEGLPKHVSIGTYSIEMRRTKAVFANPDGDIFCEQLRSNGEGVDLDLTTSDALGTLRASGMTLDLRDMQWQTDGAELYSVGELTWSDDTHSLAMINVAFGPIEEPVEYSRHLDEERDVIKGTVEKVLVRGLEVMDLPSSGTWRVAHVEVSKGGMLVLRDKVLPDGPLIFKPLLSRLIRELPIGAGVDTLQLLGCDIRYHERAEVDRGYGKLHFADLVGLVTGAIHDTSDAAVLGIKARCTVQQHAAMDFNFSAAIKDTTDLFELEANVAGLGLDELNGVLGPLANIQATEGRMDTLVLSMTGDNVRASGKVRFVYSGLRLAQGHRPEEASQGSIGSRLINLIVKKDARDAMGQVRDGSFTLDRRRDRSMFNYLWLGLREGASNVLLPEVMTR